MTRRMMRYFLNKKIVIPACLRVAASAKAGGGRDPVFSGFFMVFGMLLRYAGLLTTCEEPEQTLDPGLPLRGPSNGRRDDNKNDEVL